MSDNFIKITPISLSSSTVKADAPVITEEKARHDKKLRKACADFESIFVYQMLKTMRNTVPQSGLTGKMTGKETYQTMMDQKVADELSTKGGLGIQGALLKQLDHGQVQKGKQGISE